MNKPATLHFIHILECIERIYKYTQIKWNQISGFRNILVHDYLGEINKEQIWNVIEKYLPELQAAIRQELPEWKALIR